MIDVRSLNRDEALKRIRIEKARLRFLDFVRATKKNYVAEKVHEFIADKLQEVMERVERGESPRLMLFMPPQEGKSELVSRKFPGYVLGKHPDWKIILVSYAADLAEDMSREARRVIESDEYAEIFPKTRLDPSSQAIQRWGIEGRDGGFRAIGIGGGITGKSADILIVDDPVAGRVEADSDTYRKTQWSWWPQASDRVQEPGAVILLMTRWHHDDLAGRLLKQAKENPEVAQWEVISFPALAEENDPLGREVGEPLAPSRHTRERLLREQALGGGPNGREWLAKFQQRPSAEEGSIFKAETFRFEEDPKPAGFVFMTADTAFSEKTSADYSVVGVWRRETNAYRLLHVYRARVGFPQLKIDVRALYERATREWGPPVALWVEQAASGQSLIQEFQADSVIPVLPWKPDRSKEARAHAATYQFASKRVIFPPNMGPNKPVWLDDYISELLTFPVAAHDDQVDMTTMALTLHAEVQEPTEKPVTHEFTWDDRGDDNEESQDLMDQLSGVPHLRAAFAEKRRREQEHAIPTY